MLARAAEPAAPAPGVHQARPRVALVLSGGGARGLAHIGVLRVLQELRVPVDMVVGTSMGGVIGGAYAAGASVADLERMARQTDWERVMADRPGREQLQFRRREEDLLLPSRIEFGVSGSGLTLPPAAAGNAALEHTLTLLLPDGTRDRPVNQLALPFRSVASDLVTGELVDLAETPLFQTVRASLAVPGVFPPVRIGSGDGPGRLVVDGGLVRNLPVDLAHRMGADVVIAVNVGTPLASEQQLVSALGVAQQMINILTEQNVQRSIRELRPQDVLIAPRLANVSFLDFRSAPQAIRAGEEAARAMAAVLAPLALPEQQYARLESARQAPPPGRDAALPLRTVTVQTDGHINPRALEAQTGLKAGRAVTHEQARTAAESLYGRGDLERIQTEVRDEGGARDVAIRVLEAPWARSRVRVGLELGTDFDDANSFALKLLHVKTSLNAWGGELRTFARVGDERELGVQWHQPLGPGSQWYIAPEFQWGAASYDSFTDGRRSERKAINVRGVTLALGRHLGSWGDIAVGVSRQRGDTRIAIPDVGLEGKGDKTVQFLRYRVDTLDSVAFPSRGMLLEVQGERGRVRLRGSGSDDYTDWSLLGMQALGLDDWAGHLYGELSHSTDDEAPVRLGGFLRLSGTPANAVGGRYVALGRLVLARRIGALPLALGGTVRAGFSIEAGGGFDPKVPLPNTPFRQAASGFLSVDTRFGPVYLGAGATREGRKTAYIYLGPIW